MGKKKKQEKQIEGKELQDALNKLIETKDKNDYLKFMDVLSKSKVYIPCLMNISDEDMERFKNAKAGDTVSIKSEIRYKPDNLISPDNHRYLPIFTNTDEADQEYISHFHIVCMYISDLMKLYDNLKGEAEGLLLDYKFNVINDSIDLLKYFCELNNRKKLYIKLNDEAKAYFEYEIKKGGEDYIYPDELNHLANKNILFILKAIFEQSGYSNDVIIHDREGLFDKDVEFFKRFNFKHDHKKVQKSDDSSLVIELETGHPFMLVDYINNCYDGGFKLAALTEEKAFHYLVVPSTYYMDGNKELINIYTNIEYRLNKYDHLQIKTIPKDLVDNIFDEFICIEIYDKDK